MNIPQTFRSSYPKLFFSKKISIRPGNTNISSKKTAGKRAGYLSGGKNFPKNINYLMRKTAFCLIID